MYADDAELWCDDCGPKRCGVDHNDYVDETYSETDCPSHCAAGADCPNGNGEVGVLLSESLTADGVAYVVDAIWSYAEPGPVQGDGEVLQQWADEWGDLLCDEVESRLRELGNDRGYNVASWQDSPEIGDEIPREVDWVGYRTVTEENQGEVWEMFARESESNGRQYSPFEMTAATINELESILSGDFWSAFDEGIDDGIAAEYRSRFGD